MIGSIFSWERRDALQIRAAERRAAIIKKLVLWLLVIGAVFAARMAWEQWTLHERSAETAFVQCVDRVAAYPLDRPALVANVHELCSF